MAKVTITAHTPAVAPAAITVGVLFDDSDLSTTAKDGLGSPPIPPPIIVGADV